MCKAAGRHWNRWAIVLAGGEGERLRPFIQRWLGRHKPKQYCAFTGERSMLEESLDRISGLVPSERTLTVIGPGHRKYLRQGPDVSLPCRIIEQPSNKDTAPGIFMPAARILKEDPSATVLIFPSDHFIAPPDRFLEHVSAAADLAERWTDRLVLLGALPDAPETEYGWIQPDRDWTTAAGAMRVLRFREKPGAEDAAAFWKEGCFWNTMVMAVKIRTLWDLGRRCMPQVMNGFEAMLPAIATPQETLAMSVVYGTMPSADFSSGLLERVAERTLVLPMPGVEWSDWGRPQRIARTLRKAGRRPAFPMPALRERYALA